QTVMSEVLVTLTKMVAPILSFTAEEIWETLPESLKDSESVLLTDWYVNNDQYLNDELDTKWEEIAKLRKDVNKTLELARQGENKIIGNSLDAKVILNAADADLERFLQENKEILEEVFIVSQLVITNEKDDSFVKGEEQEALFVKVEHADGEKCERCWKYSTELGTNPEHETICPRCTSALVD
ncbi:MAG: class I tRNA ligase family protein, partial [Cetobacterium sp.]